MQLSNPQMLTEAVNNYTATFATYITQFFNWGLWLFYAFLVIMMVWLCLWRAFDYHSFHEAMPGFIKEFFIVALFYTIMSNAGPWLNSIVNTATSMGTTLAHESADPTSIIINGIALANTILEKIKQTSVLQTPFSMIMTAVTYLVVLFSFIAIALDLAVTIIATTFLISLSGLALAFSAFHFTRSVARKTLDTVIANSFKLLSLYVVIAAGYFVMKGIANLLASDIQNALFENYAWIATAALLFWMTSRVIPQQVTRIFAAAIQEGRMIVGASTAISSHVTLPNAHANISNAALLNSSSILTESTLSSSEIANSKLSQSTSEQLNMAEVPIDNSSYIAEVSLARQFKNLSSKLSSGQLSTTAPMQTSVSPTAPMAKPSSQNFSSGAAYQWHELEKN